MDTGFESPKAIRVTDHHTLRMGEWTLCASKIERMEDGKSRKYGQLCIYEGTSWRGVKRLQAHMTYTDELLLTAFDEWKTDEQARKAAEAEAKEREAEEDAGESE